MILINGNKLIIEINCINETPLAKLSNMQNGLISLIGAINHEEAPKNEIQDGLSCLKDLLKETLINDMQSSKLNDLIADNTELKEAFQNR